VLEFAKEMPPSLFDAWITTDKLIAEKPAVIQKALNAVFGGLQYVRENRNYALKSISMVHGVPEAIAVQQYEGVMLKLLPAGEIRPEWITAWLDLARLGGMTGLAPTEATYTTAFKPVPTRP
jgi:NitT/TauT family transport system substrate-binding protein